MLKTRRAAALGRAVAFASSIALVSSTAIGIASAATLQIVGGTNATLPNGGVNGGFDPAGWPSYDGVGPGDNVKVFNATNIVGGGLKVLPAVVDLTFTFLGKEAGNTKHQVLWGGNQILHNTDLVGKSVPKPGYDTGPNGWVPLTFLTDGQYTGNAGSFIKNGTQVQEPNGSPGLYMAFSEVFTGNGSNGGPLGSSWVYAFFGDGLGDKDFDDMVVKIFAYSKLGSPGAGPVPLPPALVLFGSALVGLTSLAR